MFILGLNTIDPIILENICNEIQLEQFGDRKPPKPVYMMFLSFQSALDAKERLRQSGRFIGKNGQYLRRFEDKYNVRVNIVNRSSSKKLRQKLIEIKNKTGKQLTNELEGIYLLLTKKNTSVKSTISIDEIKQLIKKKWNEISEDMQIQRQHRLKHAKSRQCTTSMWFEFSCDDRWHPKRRDHSQKIPIEKKECSTQIDVASYSRISYLQRLKACRKLSRVIRHRKNIAFGMME
ncbi:unnamed protein product [Rotaria sp. Silwood2]|nr:unnamed protein product [Rotaria sp. Silwood2]CAF4679463.1 unnamed protein product [Rotaria sp. Silwood2]